MDATYIQARIVATKAQIEAYEGAALAFGNENTQSYTLDSGQGRQTVTRANLAELQKTIDTLYNRLNSLEMRLNSGSITVQPLW